METITTKVSVDLCHSDLFVFVWWFQGHVTTNLNGMQLGDQNYIHLLFCVPFGKTTRQWYQQLVIAYQTEFYSGFNSLCAFFLQFTSDCPGSQYCVLRVLVHQIIIRYSSFLTSLPLLLLFHILYIPPIINQTTCLSWFICVVFDVVYHVPLCVTYNLLHQSAH